MVTACTRDTFHEGNLVLWQPARGAGYRVNVDALHLAEFARRERPVGHAVDLGSGVGAVGLSLLVTGAAARLTFVELDERLAELCGTNVSENGHAERARVLLGDVAEDRFFSDVPSAALVVANPPYIEPGRGRPSSPHLRGAREGKLAPFVWRARTLLGRRGRACFVYPARELTQLVDIARETGLEAKRLRFVHATRDVPARVVLVELKPGKPGGLEVEPPLVEG